MNNTSCPAHSREMTLITNNPACKESFEIICGCMFDEGWSYGDVMRQARDLVHMGYHLFTHPLAGSMKPNQTPYRSVLLGPEAPGGMAEFDSVLIIEQAMVAYEKFQRQRPTPAWRPEICKDFQTIDLSLMQGALSRIGLAYKYR